MVLLDSDKVSYTVDRIKHNRTIRAFGMASGGLDSRLALCVIRDLGVHVIALHFFHRFNKVGAPGTWPDTSTLPPPVEHIKQAALETGVEFHAMDFSDTFLTLVNRPQHGRGKGFNPCLDCRIEMLALAREMMAEFNVSFIFTGEVLGQRPMSQTKQGLQRVERRSGLDGLLVRPLSARLLEPTLPEQNGWIARNALYSFQGRNRKPQFELAAAYGIHDYPQPAGGCFLTDPNIVSRFFTWAEHHGDIGPREMVLFRIGRHFDLPGGTHAVMGRNKEENELIASILPDMWHLFTKEPRGASVYLLSRPENDDLTLAARLAARYSRTRTQPYANVVISTPGGSQFMEVKPADDELAGQYRI